MSENPDMFETENTPKDDVKSQKRERFGINVDLRNYIKEFKEDNKITTENLYEKALMVGSIRAKWLEYYKVEEDNLKLAKQKRDILMNKLSSSKGNNVSVLAKKNKDRISETDDTIKLLDEIIENIKNNIDYILRAMDILSTMNYSISNAKDLLIKMRS